jgi:hypothetical protein
LEAKHIAVTFGVSHGASPSVTNLKHSLILSHTGKSASSLNVYVSSSNGSFGERGDFVKLLFLNKEDCEVVVFAPRALDDDALMLLLLLLLLLLLFDFFFALGDADDGPFWCCASPSTSS